MRKRSTIDWEPCDGRLVGDLARFKARARGRRLKDLALLGLMAESLGARLDDSRLGLVGFPVVMPPAAPAPTAAPTAAANDADVLSQDHQAGVNRLLGNFD